MNRRSLVILLAVWLLSVGYMLARGRTDTVTIGTDVVWPLIVLLLGWLTLRIASQPPQEIPFPHERRPQLVAQLCIIGAVVVLTAIRGMNAHGVTAIQIPGWTALLAAFSRIGAPFGLATEAANFGSYVVLPGVLAIALGARLSETGFARFAPRSGRIAALWLALPAAVWGVALATRQASPAFMLFQLVRNFFSNGFSEEFLWRGLLFTRLRGLFSTETSMWIQAVLFGCWHIGYDYSAAPHHDISLMLADMVASQIVMGYALAWLMLRTRNLWIPTALHAAFDSLGDAFGAK